METLSRVNTHEKHAGWLHHTGSDLSDFSWSYNDWTSLSSKSSLDGDQDSQFPITSHYGINTNCGSESVMGHTFSPSSLEHLQNSWVPTKPLAGPPVDNIRSFPPFQHSSSTSRKPATMTPRDMDKIPLLQSSFNHNQIRFHSHLVPSVDVEPASSLSSHKAAFPLVSKSQEDSEDDSSQGAEFEMPLPTRKRKVAPGYRRISKPIEPDSARAIYLEKNRKAATKCRNKQRLQQEALVETARDEERQNKMLKAEVASLKADLGELMAIVGTHAKCSDGRLRMYVQREADRLAFEPRSPSAGGTSTEQDFQYP
ncbi:hypothetical protein P154DRAFT_605004 [Amniculicola lignicola CBS 123094]|uniref:BZIP domain-containing protein n=1 Tax=Amniculicola lignicola CBS 123094 TaxID=1392246 RepID=A0A6A5W737_9PLEO|nr:hypothetical protein P154DRAFT_605004 [Amniculicola lignicola CBS 123094]